MEQYLLNWQTALRTVASGEVARNPTFTAGNRKTKFTMFASKAVYALDIFPGGAVLSSAAYMAILSALSKMEKNSIALLFAKIGNPKDIKRLIADLPRKLAVNMYSYICTGGLHPPYQKREPEDEFELASESEQLVDEAADASVLLLEKPEKLGQEDALSFLNYILKGGTHIVSLESAILNVVGERRKKSSEVSLSYQTRKTEDLERLYKLRSHE